MKLILKKFLDFDYNKTLPYLFLFYFLYLLISSMGGLTRYDLLGHIGSADRFFQTGQIYPLIEINEIYPTISEYFPGLTILSIFFGYLLPSNFLVEFMHIISVLVILYFFFIQKKIIDKSFEKIKTNNYWPFIIIFTILIVKNWLGIALAFKADTLALSLGLTGIYLANFQNKDNNYSFLFLGSLLFGFSLIFKQQYVSIIIAMLIFGLFKKNKKILIFSIFPMIFLLFFSNYLLNNEIAYNITITSVLSSGFYSFKEWILFNHPLIKIFIYLFCAFLIFSNFSLNFLFLRIKKNMGPIYKNLNSSPYFFILIIFSLSAFASSIKIGGNLVNTELGVVCLLPIIYYLLSIHKIKKNHLILVSWIVLFINLFSNSGIQNSIMNFQNSVEMKKFVSKLESKKQINILTDSTAYYTVRSFKGSGNFDNLRTTYLANGIKNKKSADIILKEILDKKNYEYIILANIDSINKILNVSKYSIIFENELGIVWKKSFE